MFVKKIVLLFKNSIKWRINTSQPTFKSLVWTAIKAVFCFLCGVIFITVVLVRDNNEKIIRDIEKMVLLKEFSGADECKTFQCFGKSFCNLEATIQLNSSKVVAGKDVFTIWGNLTSRYRVVKKVKVNLPLLHSCGDQECTVKLSQNTFSSANYRSWICRKFMKKDDCNHLKMLREWPAMKSLLSKTAGRLPVDILRGISPPLQCATQRMADRVLRRLGTKGSINLKDYTYGEKAELLFTSKLSPSTVIQTMFPPREGWPLEAVYGSCGLVTFHGGGYVTSLYDVYHAPWKVRLDVAVQFLNIAHYFTENELNYMILLHRMRPEDIGLSESGRLRIQNTDNLVVVDQADESTGFFSEPYEVPFHKHKLKLNEDNICRYNVTDINYYSVCRHFLGGSWKYSSGEILKGGLLHHPVEEQSHFANEMYVLLDICIRGRLALPKDTPPSTKGIRSIAAAKLRKLLMKKRTCQPQFRYRYPECQYEQKLHYGIYNLPDFELKWLGG
ncbi:divergent protein kinase domain 2B-like [Clavelina lepadiformis]|uniref:divergent protein kinase domain 2B-like n=1 Tax=Clavelina lepadiformis TaxID=159417 RepID=UPI0040425DDE